MADGNDKVDEDVSFRRKTVNISVLPPNTRNTRSNLVVSPFQDGTMEYRPTPSAPPGLLADPDFQETFRRVCLSRGRARSSDISYSTLKIPRRPHSHVGFSRRKLVDSFTPAVKQNFEDASSDSEADYRQVVANNQPVQQV